jgi:hypothetical protein
MQAHHVYAPIAALDLSTVRIRLMHRRAGLGWNEARTLAAESDYREFLLFAKMYPAETPSPTADVDAFWHFHILDTVKYARDCDNAFGYFLHHKPDVEFDDDDRRADLAQAAYCALARPLAAGAAAYCALARPSAPAYCAVAQAGGAKKAAYCAKARPAKAYCAAAAPL